MAAPPGQVVSGVSTPVVPSHTSDTVRWLLLPGYEPQSPAPTREDDLYDQANNNPPSAFYISPLQFT